jgi:hypothetical protein
MGKQRVDTRGNRLTSLITQRSANEYFVASPFPSQSNSLIATSRSAEAQLSNSIDKNLLRHTLCFAAYMLLKVWLELMTGLPTGEMVTGCISTI